MAEHDEPALREIPGGWTERTLNLAGRAFVLELPADPDAFLDDPAVQARHARDGYMPYWGYLWPACLETAAWVLRHPWPPGIEALEIGAGTGLVGVAALAAGLDVTFSDYDQQSVDVCLVNARRNGFTEARGLVLDWRTPITRQFPVILGCDVIYEAPNHAPILELIRIMLSPGGECWLSDPGRHQADAFVRLARSEGFLVDATQLAQEPFPDRPPDVTTLWRIRGH